MNFVITGWSIDTHDFQNTLADYTGISAIIRDTLNKNPTMITSHIVLLHDIYEPTPLALDYIVDLVNGFGYTAVGLDQCMNTKPYRTGRY